MARRGVGSAQSGAEAPWGGQTAYGMGSHQMYGSGGQVAAEVGYGLPVGARFVGTPRVGLTTSEYGRDHPVGYGLGVLDRRKRELGARGRRAAARDVDAGPSQQRVHEPGHARLVERLRDEPQPVRVSFASDSSSPKLNLRTRKRKGT